MKIGYPDTINNKAYKQVSPLKARYTSSGEGEDLEAVELKSGSLAKKKSPVEYNDTPINMVTPIKAVSPVKNKEKASSEAKASARKVAKGRKKYAKAHEASSQGFQETRKSKRLNKAGDRKTDKGREIANKLSPEQTEKAVEIFTKRVDKQDKKAERKKKSPAKFASAAQRKAVWASKNEKKKK